MEHDIRLAVLIDAENIPNKNIKEILEEISKYGIPTIKRIYADWTKPQSNGWKDHLLEHSITPIQQYSYTTGKNSSDSAMIIDAMDVLYEDKVDGFCIVSSDSDFTRLAVRLREAGKKVIGIGEKKTPSAFIAACEKFIYLEILAPAVKEKETEKASKEVTKAASPVSAVDKALTDLISKSIFDLGDEQGWVFLSILNVHLRKIQPDFDPRNYGFKKISLLLKSIGKYEFDERESGNTKLIYVRLIQKLS